MTYFAEQGPIASQFRKQCLKVWRLVRPLYKNCSETRLRHLNYSTRCVEIRKTRYKLTYTCKAENDDVNLNRPS